MDLLKIYQKGEHLMQTFPLLGKLHHNMSQSIINWCRKHNFVRFDNLRAPNSTEDDVKRCSLYWFCAASAFGILAIYQIFDLNLSGFLFSLFLTFIPYAVGVINLEALKIEPKITKSPVDIETTKNKENEQLDKNIKKPLWIQLLIGVNNIICGWLLYIAYWEPEKIQQWISRYNLNDFLKSLGISESSATNIFALGVGIAYVIFQEIIMHLCKLQQKTKKNYSPAGIQRCNSSNID
jgi:hypothetical protein